MELGVDVSQRTKQLYEQIQSDTFKPPLFAFEQATSSRDGAGPTLENTLKHLEQFSLTLKSMEIQVQQEIAALETMLARKKNSSS